MAITAFEINGKPAVIATTLERVGGVTHRLFNLPAAFARTALRDKGRYTTAYNGIDYLCYAENVKLSETTGWENLRMDHDSGVEWAASHSVLLT